MDWQEYLRGLLPEKTYADVSRVCGFRPGRISQILGSPSVPSAVDAIIIARYVGRTVEEIWGEAANERLRKTAAPLLKRRAGRRPPTEPVEENEYDGPRPGEAEAIVEEAIERFQRRNRGRTAGGGKRRA